jgi:hypothetical protein
MFSYLYGESMGHESRGTEKHHQYPQENHTNYCFHFSPEMYRIKLGECNGSLNLRVIEVIGNTTARNLGRKTNEVP